MMPGDPGPLMKRQHVGSNPATGFPVFAAICRDCGDVTAEESHGLVTEADLSTATLYAQRHLSRHLSVLAEEIREMTR